MEDIDYTADLNGKTPSQVADIIIAWRTDDNMDEFYGDACDLLNAIEGYLRAIK